MSVRIRTFADLNAQPKVVPTWIEGILPQGGIVALWGTPGAGKTFVALHMAHCLPNCIPWLGHAVTRCGSLYVAAEGSSGLAGRVRAWYDHHGIRGEDGGPVGYILTRLESHLVDVRVELRAELERTGIVPGVVFLDTLSANGPHGFNENDTAHMQEVLEGVRRLRDDFGCTVVVLHHPGWHNDRLRGSRNLEGACDVIMKLTGGPAQGPRTLSVEKARDWEAGETMHLNLVQSHDSLIVESGLATADVLKASQRAVLRALYEIGKGQAVRPSEWERASGYSKSQFYEIRSEVQSLGLIIAEARGKVSLTDAGMDVLRGMPDFTAMLKEAA